MERRGGIGRGILVVLLVIVLVGLGVRAVVSRTVERTQSDTEATTTADDDAMPQVLPTPTEVRDPTGAPSPRRAPDPTAPSAPSPPDPSAVPLTPAELDDPRRTPFAPGTEPLPPVDYDPTAPVAHRGSLPAMVIQDVVREMLPELRFCFEWQLTQHPELGGRVTMEFTIGEDGRVSEPSVAEDALGDETVTACFAHVISGLRFPPPEGGSVLVRYPFTLANSPEARRPEGI
jgi:hypothetical protein